MMGKIKITCEEASTICTKSQYNEATFLEKLKLQFHFLYCKTCRLFSKQNTQLTGICGIAKEHEALKQQQGLSDAFKVKMQEKLNKGLEKDS